MRSITRILAILLALAMLFSLSAFASGEASGEASAEPSGEASAEPSAEPADVASGESSGEASGESSGEASGGASSGGGLDLSGLLALKQYVFVASQGEIADGAVSTDCYGVYARGGEGEATFVPAAFDGAVEVYADSDLTASAEPVSASVAGGVLTVTGVDTVGNTAYYLSTGDGA